MKFKPLGVFQIYGYKMCVKLGLCLCLCFLAGGEMFRGRANADASLVPAQRGLSCPRVCSLALLLTAHLLCPYLMMLNHGVDFKTWFCLIFSWQTPTVVAACGTFSPAAPQRWPEQWPWGGFGCCRVAKAGQAEAASLWALFVVLLTDDVGREFRLAAVLRIKARLIWHSSVVKIVSYNDVFVMEVFLKLQGGKNCVLPKQSSWRYHQRKITAALEKPPVQLCFHIMFYLANTQDLCKPAKLASATLYAMYFMFIFPLMLLVYNVSVSLCL